MVIFHSYVNVYQRVFPTTIMVFWMYYSTILGDELPIFSCFPSFFDQVFRKKIRSNHRFLMVKPCETMIFVGSHPFLLGLHPFLLGLHPFLLGLHPFLLGLHPFLLLFTLFFTLSLPAPGVAVGIGTRVGKGCTSGHGICGLPRFSLRSWRLGAA